MSKKILFITIGDINVASTRVYVYQYLPYLEKDGYICDIIRYGFQKTNPFKSGFRKYYEALRIYSILIIKIISLNFKVIFKVGFYDVVFCQKVILMPFVVKILKNRNSKVIYCIDDAVYLRKSMMQVGGFTINNFKGFINKVDRIIVGSIHYFEVFKSIQHKCFFVPNAVNVDDYYKNIQSEKVVIGWIGSDNTTKYLKLIQNALIEINDKFKNKVVFKFIGANSTALPQLSFCHFKKWCLETEKEDMAMFDIGVMPLANNHWEKAKCGYKLIQYLALGIPAVVSPVGINSYYINESKGGYLCELEDEWRSSLEALILDKLKRIEMGRNGLNYAKKMHDTSKVYKKQYLPVILN